MPLFYINPQQFYKAAIRQERLKKKMQIAVSEVGEYEVCLLWQ
jgi:hypothetical protein